MTPSRATELLYNEIVPVDAVRREHDRLRTVLETTAETIELTEVLTDLAATPEGPLLIARELSLGWDIAATMLSRRWTERSPREIVRDCVLGVPAEYDRLAPRLEGPRFLTPPLPNLYFMRDASFVVHDRVYRSRMAGTVRRAEAALVSLALRHLGVSGDESPAYSAATDPIEGGDVLVYSRDLLLVGVGARTAAASVDALVTAIAERRERELTVLAAILPDDRATIHLDMILTILEPDRVLAYAPLFEGSSAVPVYRLRVPPASAGADDRWRIDEFPELRGALSACGVEVDRIPCGGADPVVREREQWFSACNSVALAPGRIVVFGNNRATLEALSRSGYHVREEAPSGAATGSDGTTPKRVAWAIDGLELARGGGGPRCMTLPIDRDDEE